MKINLNPIGTPRDNSPRRQGGTYISNNIIRTSVFLDKDGNEINPRTKQIIKRVEQ